MFRLPSLKRRFFPRHKPGVITLSPPPTPPRTPSPGDARSSSIMGVYAVSWDTGRSTTTAESHSHPHSPPLFAPTRLVDTILEDDEREGEREPLVVADEDEDEDSLSESGDADSDGDDADEDIVSEWSFGHAPDDDSVPTETANGLLIAPNTRRDVPTETDNGILIAPAAPPRREVPVATETAAGILVVRREREPEPASDAESAYEDAVEHPMLPPLVLPPLVFTPLPPLPTTPPSRSPTSPAAGRPLTPAEVPRRASSLHASSPTGTRAPSPSSTRATYREVVPTQQRGKAAQSRPSVLKRLATRADDAPPLPVVDNDDMLALGGLRPQRRRSKRKPVPYAADEHATLPSDHVSWVQALRAEPDDTRAQVLAACDDDSGTLAQLNARLDALLAPPERPVSLVDLVAPDADEAVLRMRLRARLELGDAAPPTIAAYRTLATAEAGHAAQVAWFVEERGAMKRALDKSYAAWETERDLHLRTLLRELRLRRKAHALEAELAAVKAGSGQAEGGEQAVRDWLEDVEASRREPAPTVPLQTPAEAVDRANSSIVQLVDWVDRLKVENRGLRARLAFGPGVDYNVDYNWPSE
ncbi:uncharacterized protein LOC62_05G007337 [Vanrija pseudolonga]|uniref:Uncharacterized protein n=1 Tax=Vanrija pseudolonga TaxID=143232 RepID=A0AAF1BKC2_9TREE|nr:hypothetical protein LOC62_05G007337 [Vanrija pseudolonga]